MMGWLLLAAAAIAVPDSLVAEMQRFEKSRSTAIKAGDAEALRSIYGEGFQRVDRETLLAVLQRSSGGDFVAESTVLSAREIEGVVLVEGRLKLFNTDRSRLLSDSFYFHVLRRNGDRWEMVGGAATPIPASSPQ